MVTVIKSLPKTQTQSHLTLSEFLQIPEGTTTYEFEKGQVIMMSPRPHARHQKLLMRLATVLDTFIQAHALGEIWPEQLQYVPSEQAYCFRWLPGSACQSRWCG